MANKAFEIQESKLRIGGVDLEAGATSIVIPGVTQATTYRVEEVDETGEQTNTLNLPIVIDNVTHVAKVADPGASVATYATYTVELDDEDYVDEIEVATAGTYVGSEVDRNADFDMWGYTGSDAEGYLTNWVTGDWVQIPFRPKMRAGEVENVSGGSADTLVNGDYEVVLDDNGNLTAPGNITTGTNGGRFIQDCADGITSMRWINVPQGDSTTQLIRAYTGDPKLNTEVERAQIKLNWDVTEDKSGLTIRTFDQSNPNNEVDHDWQFKGDGVLQLPVGGDIVDSTGSSVLGGGVSIDRNIWIQTFATDSGDTDKAALASSVEYDNLGNVYALFLQQQYNDLENPSTVTGSYFSVAKFASTGEKLWSVRSSSANVFTDGWGLAVDNANSAFYVAGKTAVAESYNRSFLVKFNSDDGSQVWASTLDFGNQSDSPVVDIASDGNPVIVGYLETDDALDGVTVTKISRTDGSILWSQLLDGQGDDEAYGMAVGPNGEIVAVGYTGQIGVTDAADGLYADLAGNLNWTIGGQFTGTDGLITADFTFTDGFPTFINIVDRAGGRTIDDIVATVPGSAIGGVDGVDDMVVKVETVAANDTDDRMLVVKYDSDGVIVWQKAIQFDAGYDCYGADADIDADGNVYINGNYRYDSGQAPFPTSAMSIVKFDSNGVKQWSRRVVGDCDDFTTSIVVGPENTLYLTGVTTRPGDTDKYIWVVAKYTTSGTVVWQRLIENNSQWSFSGGFFGSSGGGSSLAVKEGYVALSGAFGVPFDGASTATLVQLDFDGTVFTVGDWEVKAASFSGVLSSDASDITVINAGKTDSSLTGTITIDDSVFAFDDSNFLIPTLYRSTAGGNTGDITFDGVKIIGAIESGDLNGGGIKLIPNIAYEGAGQYVKIYPTMGQDAPHIHMAAGTGGDLLIGDDNHYVDVNHTGDIIIKADTDTSNKVRNLVENFQSNIWNGSWTSAEWSGTQIYFTEVSGSLKRWIIKYLDQSRVLGRSLIINNNVNLTYNGYSTEINGGFTIFVSDPAPSEPTAVTTMSAACTMENYVEVNANAGQLGIISRSGWNVNISAGYESDVNIDAGDDIRITAGTKVRSDNAGGIITIEAGDGGMGDHNDWGGEGGAVNIYGGNGGVGSSNYQGGDGAGILIRAGMGGASNGAGGGNGGILQLLGGDSYSNNAGGDIYIRPGASLTNGSGMVTIETVSTASVTNTWQFTKQGATVLPGAVVKSTVAKTGVDPLTVGKGRAATVTASPSNNTNLTVGTVTGVAFGTGFTLDITVAANGDISAVVTASNQAQSVGDTGTLVGGGFLGGTTPADDVVFTVATLTDVIVPTVLDLTKTVNKLTDGNYTLADGVEGQIMYLVPQDGNGWDLIDILVAHGRPFSVGVTPAQVYTDIVFWPFSNTADQQYAVVTMIFTDGAWQASNGSWD